MNKEPQYKPIDLKETLTKMKSWAKEKDRRYIEQKRFAKKIFGALIKKLGFDS